MTGDLLLNEFEPFGLVYNGKRLGSNCEGVKEMGLLGLEGEDNDEEGEREEEEGDDEEFLVETGWFRGGRKGHF